MRENYKTANPIGEYCGKWNTLHVEAYFYEITECGNLGKSITIFRDTKTGKLYRKEG